MCQLHLRCHWPPRLLSHAYNALALRGDFIVTYLPSQPKEVPNLSSVTLPFVRPSVCHNDVHFFKFSINFGELIYKYN